jgi:hypothetical protein
MQRSSASPTSANNRGLVHLRKVFERFLLNTLPRYNCTHKANLLCLIHYFLLLALSPIHLSPLPQPFTQSSRTPRNSQQNILLTRRNLNLAPSRMRPLTPHNRPPARTRHLNTLPRKRVPKHRAQIIPNLAALETIRKHLLRLPVEQAVRAFCDFDSDAPGLRVAVENLCVLGSCGCVSCL